jgi:hypothetical protein
MLPKFLQSVVLSLSLVTVIVGGACTAEASKSPLPRAAAATTEPATSITITPNSPADTVRAFYTRLREGKFREAIHLTNLRPAIEGLTDDELREFSLDFAAIARLVPAELEINGEIISGDHATVTAKLPGDDPDVLELQEVQLRKNGNYWVILTVDDAAEEAVKREGKNYFYALKLETHQEEAKAMLERIAKAQIAYSVQHGGKYADISQLIEVGYLPADIMTSDSTGYRYELHLEEGRGSYYATATPAEYGRTGKMSYLLQPAREGLPRVTATDNGGKPIRN